MYRRGLMLKNVKECDFTNLLLDQFQYQIRKLTQRLNEDLIQLFAKLNINF